MRIYFETGALRDSICCSKEDFIHVATCECGYANMIRDAYSAIKSDKIIYTNELSLIGADELWGDHISYDLYLRDNNNKWYKVNSYLLQKLSPLCLEDYIRKHICYFGG